MSPEAQNAGAPSRWMVNARADLALACIPLPDGVQYEQLAVNTRYPGESEPVTENDYLDAIRLATLAVRWAQSKIDTTE